MPCSVWHDHGFTATSGLRNTAGQHLCNSWNWRWTRRFEEGVQARLLRECFVLPIGNGDGDQRLARRGLVPSHVGGSRLCWGRQRCSPKPTKHARVGRVWMPSLSHSFCSFAAPRADSEPSFGLRSCFERVSNGGGGGGGEAGGQPLLERQPSSPVAAAYQPLGRPREGAGEGAHAASCEVCALTVQQVH